MKKQNKAFVVISCLVFAAMYILVNTIIWIFR